MTHNNSVFRVILGLAKNCNWLVMFLAIILYFPQIAVAEMAKIVRLDDDFRVTLDDQTRAKLAGIAPIGQARATGWLHQPLRIERGERDRYGTPLIWAYRGETSLQQMLIRQGAAIGMHPSLMPLPVPQNAQFNADDAELANGRYARIHGRVAKVAILKSGAYINFGEDWKSDFTIYLPKETLKQFDEATLNALEGRMVAGRGFVHRYYGPRITLFNPALLEILDEPIKP